MNSSYNAAEVFDIFPNPIAIYQYENHHEVKEKIFRKISESKETSNDYSKQLIHYCNDIGESFLYESEFKKFKEWMVGCCNTYVENILGNELVDTMLLTDSWINVANTGAFQYPHYHANSFISGTYYVNLEENHAPLFFKHPKNLEYSLQPVINLKNKIPTKYNCDAKINPIEGCLFLWQSNLCHGYHYNDLDDRISISMNFIPSYINSGKYGFKTTVEKMLQVSDRETP